MQFSLNKLKITQRFGENPQIYSKFGHKGHNGIDCIPVDSRGRKVLGDSMFAMLPGVWHLLTEQYANGKYYGYGAAWKLDYGLGNGTYYQFTFAHLKNRRKEYDGKNLHEGPRMAQMGNTGFSTGDHYHITQKLFNRGKVVNWGNGYNGAINPLPFLKKIGFKFINE